MKFSFVALAILPLLAQAADLIAWVGSGCKGTSLRCSNIQSGVCCNAGGNTIRSARIQNVSGRFEHVIWSQSNCKGSSSKLTSTACLDANWPIWSLKWNNKNSKRSYPIDHESNAEKEDCIDADTVVFESGKAKKIPAGAVNKVAALVRSGATEDDVFLRPLEDVKYEGH